MQSSLSTCFVTFNNKNNYIFNCINLCTFFYVRRIFNALSLFIIYMSVLRIASHCHETIIKNRKRYESSVSYLSTRLYINKLVNKLTGCPLIGMCYSLLLNHHSRDVFPVYSIKQRVTVYFIPYIIFPKYDYFQYAPKSTLQLHIDYISTFH